MTREEAILKLAVVAEMTDTEVAHSEADDVLCDMLDTLGYHAVVEAWYRVKKWYA
jgi:hypothetical protein